MKKAPKPISLGDILIYPLWFDSMGAKSSSLLVETPDIRLLVDPGASEMQPSFPLPPDERKRLREEALGVIKEAAKEADTVFISHYHYDHHTHPLEAPELYRGKELWIKDPNRFINRSQWDRARIFVKELSEISGEEFEAHLGPPGSLEASFDSWPTRRKKDKKWVEDLVSLWRGGEWVREGRIGDMRVRFADGREFRKGGTRVLFTEPLFHGGEYDRVGWVVAMLIECGGKKLLYSSDLQGPVIEAYASWIVREFPDVLILDGPPTYLLGYLFGQRDLQRAIANTKAIIEGTAPELIIYDHHLPRDPKFRERTQEVWELAKKRGRKFLTCAELFGEEPVVLSTLQGP